jgi:hypothetical protein
MVRFANNIEKIEYKPSNEDFDKAVEYFKNFLRKQTKINTSEDLLDDMMYDHIRHIEGIGDCFTIVRFCLRNNWWGKSLFGNCIVAPNNPNVDAMLNVEISTRGDNHIQIYFHEGIFLHDNWVKSSG